jgi:hypothetical protein
LTAWTLNSGVNVRRAFAIGGLLTKSLRSYQGARQSWVVSEIS